MASVDKARLLRQLIPKSYHFDGYSEINCPNQRDRPFFADNVIPMGSHHLTTRLVDSNTISIELSSPCEKGYITFNPYLLSLSVFAEKVHEATKNDRDYIVLEIKPNYQLSHRCNQARCDYSNRDCRYLKTKHPSQIYAAVSFDFSEMKDALAMYFEITPSTNNGGKKAMANRKNRFFGMNFEFGVSKDPNISSTLMGVAVRNTSNNNWYVFDPKTLTRKNIAGMKLGSFPVMYMPTDHLVVGHLYKIDNQYCYVQSINTDGTVTLMSGADGNIRQHVLEQSIIPGLNFYTEVIVFDASTMMNPASGENVGNNILAAILMMQWSKGGNKAEFSLDDINDDSFNGLGSYLPFLMASGNGANLFAGADGKPNLMALMALGSDDFEGSDIMQILVLNQLFNNGNSSSVNAFSGLFQAPETAATKLIGGDMCKVICPSCKSTYDSDTNFCPKCGEKTVPAAQNCRKCGATLMEGASFCHKCGEKVGISVCTECGKELPDGSSFCPNCGHSVNAPAVPFPPKPAASPVAESPASSEEASKTPADS